MAHENALQAIADANDGTRAAGTPGYDASVEYVAGLLEDAGYDVTIQEFTYDRFVQNSPSEFSRLSPDPEVYIDGFDQDFVAMSYSGSGNIPSAQLVAVGGIVIPSPGGAASGCAASDFAGFPAGAVALIQRGTCTFRQKADNADAAGAAGVVIFNEGNVDPTDDRLGVVNGTLDPPQCRHSGDRNVVRDRTGAVQPDAVQAARARAPEGRRVRGLDPDVERDRRHRIRARRSHRRRRAHLDSVLEGPGINDNGSGSSTILEVALQMAELGIDTDEPRALHLLGRRRGRADRLAELRRLAVEERAEGHHAVPQLRHGRLAELRALRVRR